MSAGNHRDRTGRNAPPPNQIDDECAYMTNLSRQVSKACDEFFERTNGTKPYSLRDVITKAAKAGHKWKTIRKRNK
jgi:hypothetical protein